MPINPGELKIAIGTSSPNEIYTAGVAPNFKSKINNPSGLSFYDIYTNTSKTQSGILIAPGYEKINFNGTPITNNNLPSNFKFRDLRLYHDGRVYLGSSADEYLILGPVSYPSFLYYTVGMELI